MGPPFLNGGNGECCRPRNRQHSTFNGAAVSQRRKHPGIVGRFGGTESPSMGPPFLNGGNRKDSKRPQLGSISFNGAAVSQRRKQDTTATVQTVGFPSMGPPFLNGGNLLSCELLDALELLQWGRRFSTAETAMILSAPPSSRSLQWGRRFSTAETRTRRGGVGVGASLQWGRRFSTAETPWDCRQIRGHRITFNGAAVSQRRKQEGQQATAARIDILQW